VWDEPEESEYRGASAVSKFGSRCVFAGRVQITDSQNHQSNYDQLNRLVQKSYPDTTTVNYTYDLDSRLTQVTDPTGTYQFTFDNMGRLTGTSTQYAFLTSRTLTTGYSYDAASNRTGFTDPENGSTGYVYDTLNRLQTLTPPAAISGGNFGFTYDALSRRTGLTRPNGVNTTYSYDNLSHLLSVTHANGGTTLDGEIYTLDNAGNRTAKDDLYAGVTTNYSYDSIYELLSATQSNTTTESYTYDPVGNRLSNLTSSGWSYNTSNELTSRPTVSYSYDANGNTTSKTDSTGTTTYSWDFENRLVTVGLPNSGGTVYFRYDPWGHRIYKQSPNSTSIFAYDGDDLVETVNATGSVVARYSRTLRIDEPLAMLRGTTTDYYGGGWSRFGHFPDRHQRSAGANLHLRLLRQYRGHDRHATELLPIHRTRIRHGSKSLLLPRQILRPQCWKVRFRGPHRFQRGNRLLCLRKE
jgi:YD repeat-containing protein